MQHTLTHSATGCDYFSVPVELGPQGAVKVRFSNRIFCLVLTTQAVNILPSATAYEKKLLQACYDGLKGNIDKGIEFVKNPPPPKQ